MRAILFVMMLVATGRSAADDRPRLRGLETPRATDLLHAKKLAERVEKRLSTPRARGPGWRHGGIGWETAFPESPAPSAPGTIHIGKARRRRAHAAGAP